MSMETKYKYCLFDLDGTLTDPGIGITNSVMYALSKYGISVTDRKELYPFIGPPLPDSFRKYFGFTEAQALQAVEYYRENFRSRGIFENTLYPDIPGLLKDLREKHAVICLATSKPFEFAELILKHFDLYRYFDHIGAADMDGRVSRKADVIARLLGQIGDIDRSSVLMTGDRDQDIEGAKANRIKSAGVLWGYGSYEELRDAGADYLIKEPAELLTLF